MQAVNDSIKYVSVEVLKSGTTLNVSGVSTGMLRSIQNKMIISGNKETSCTYLVLGTCRDPDELEAYKIALDSFTVVSVTIAKDAVKELIVYSRNDVDQKLALDTLTLVFDKLVKTNMMMESDCMLVDVSKYRDIPNEFKGTNVYAAPWQNKYETSEKYTDWRSNKELEEKQRNTPLLMKRIESIKMGDINLIRKKVIEVSKEKYKSKSFFEKIKRENDNASLKMANKFTRERMAEYSPGEMYN